MASMQGDAMSYGHVVFHDRWKLAIGDVNYGIILDVRITADSYVMNIAANRRIKPDAGMRTDHHIADHLRAILDKNGFIKLRTFIQIRSNHSCALKINPYYNSGEN